ncbi:hypothetical protein D7322_12740 [Sphingobacterium puteale]|uniref:Uncharacterized protein n=1 Tax=Sphingobacterium puteale TaxID=2420510 RepID=A0A420VXR4_9SPHI|nr:hypothetical protein D7322_12740 [Sphingobacterium puteale]
MHRIAIFIERLNVVDVLLIFCCYSALFNYSAAYKNLHYLLLQLAGIVVRRFFVRTNIISVARYPKKQLQMI